MKNYNLNLMKIILSIFCIIVLNTVNSQEALSLEETFSIALKENIDIKISINNKEKAQNHNMIWSSS